MKRPPGNLFAGYSRHNKLVFVLRHGQIDAPLRKTYIGITDVPLNAAGIAQAHYWQQAFQSLAFDAVYSSPLRRCRRTAGIIAGRRKVKIKEQLSEINLGEWENREFDHIKRRDPARFDARGRHPETVAPPGGESFQDVHDRAMPFFKRLSKSNHRALVITHAGVIRVLICRLTHTGLDRVFRIPLSYGELLILKKDCFL